MTIVSVVIDCELEPVAREYFPFQYVYPKYTRVPETHPGYNDAEKAELFGQ